MKPLGHDKQLKLRALYGTLECTYIVAQGLMAAMRAREAASRLGHLLPKASRSIAMRLVGSVTVTREMQRQKARKPMEVTPSGMVMAVRERQSPARCLSGGY